MVSTSIALATFNGEAYLRRQLESLAWQTRTPDELVIADDCSRDGTVAIIEEFSRSAPFPVRLAVNERTLNFRANFLNAANMCSSDVILFCDQDDVWRPHKIARIVQAFSEVPDLALVYHNATVVDAHERSLYPMFDAVEQVEILSRDVPPPWHYARGLVQAFKRELLAFDDLWPMTCEHFECERLGHDRWYFFLALAMGRVEFLDEDLLLYRQHGRNAWGADRQLGWADRIRARWGHGASSDVLGAAGARARVAVLQALMPRVPEGKRARIALLSQAYGNYAERLERRALTFAARSLSARGVALARSIGSGDYCGNPWGFDPRSILRDAVAGVAGIGG
jgi:glycosyltransferase involved in cell wall biosynthesis